MFVLIVFVNYKKETFLLLCFFNFKLFNYNFSILNNIYTLTSNILQNYYIYDSLFVKSHSSKIFITPLSYV